MNGLNGLKLSAATAAAAVQAEVAAEEEMRPQVATRWMVIPFQCDESGLFTTILAGDLRMFVGSEMTAGVCTDYKTAGVCTPGTGALIYCLFSVGGTSLGVDTLSLNCVAMVASYESLSLLGPALHQILNALLDPALH